MITSTAKLPFVDGARNIGIAYCYAAIDWVNTGETIHSMDTMALGHCIAAGATRGAGAALGSIFERYKSSISRFTCELACKRKLISLFTKEIG